MKIKHFAGYGCVNATKVSSKALKGIYGEPLTRIVIRVRGNHEWGIERKDVYDAFNWLLKKHFAKNLKDYRCVEDMQTNSFYEKLPNGVDEEVCDYTFLIREM